MLLINLRKAFSTAPSKLASVHLCFKVPLCWKMFGSLISPHAFLDFFYKSSAGLHSFVTEIVNISLAKLLLGSQYILQEIQRLDTYGEKLFNQLGIVLMTRWKLLLILIAIILCIFKLLRKTRKLEIGLKYIVMFRNCLFEVSLVLAAFSILKAVFERTWTSRWKIRKKILQAKM